MQNDEGRRIQRSVGYSQQHVAEAQFAAMLDMLESTSAMLEKGCAAMSDSAFSQLVCDAVSSRLEGQGRVVREHRVVAAGKARLSD